MSSPSTKELPLVWSNVRVKQNGELKSVTTSASLRWWYDYDCGQNKHINGSVTLQHFAGTPLFRLLYCGKEVKTCDNPKDSTIRGALYLPIDHLGGVYEDPIFQYEWLQGRHSKAHGIRLNFKPNYDHVKSIQIVVPVMNGNEDPGLLFRDALKFADEVRISFAKNEKTYAMTSS